jgi:sugar lactone lactonase YvrE
LVAFGVEVALAGEPETDEHGGEAGIRGHIYWTNPETSRGSGGPGIDTVGRAELNGTSVEKSFIADVAIPGAIALDSHHIYWTNTETGAIGRADLDGTHVDQSFISDGGAIGALAVDARHIYWASGGSVSSPAAIARANIDGTGIDPGFLSIGPGSFIAGLAVNRHHIYWTNRDEGTIGQADLSGSHIKRELISSAKDPTGLVLDSRHLYWANDPTGGASAAIGRSRLDGAQVHETFITGVSEPFGVAVDSRHIYWANYGSQTIGRAGLNGSHPDQSFIVAGATEPAGESSPMGVAVGR